MVKIKTNHGTRVINENDNSLNLVNAQLINYDFRVISLCVPSRGVRAIVRMAFVSFVSLVFVSLFLFLRLSGNLVGVSINHSKSV